MKYFYKLLLVITLLPSLSFAQHNYKPGYVVTLKGDTLRGFIDYREWDVNPATISFKKDNLAGELRKLTPDDIIFFSVDNLGKYQKYTGRISQDRIDADHINYGKDTSSKIASVFLEILAKSDKVTLLYYVDDVRPNFYIEQAPDHIPQTLTYNTYVIDDEKTGKAKTVDNVAYKKQLYALALKYNALTDKLEADIQQCSYNKPSILDIINKIDDVNKAALTTQDPQKSHIVFFAGAGLNITHWAPTSSYQEAGGKNYTSYLPAVSAGINIFANPNTGRLIFRFEGTVAASNYKSVYDNLVSPYVHITYSFQSISFNFTPQIIYNFYNADNFKFYGGLGLDLAFYKYSNASYKAPDGSMVYTSADPFAFRSINAPVMVKAGIMVNKKVEVFADYLTSSPVSDDYVFRVNFSSIQIGVNYYFR